LIKTAEVQTRIGTSTARGLTRFVGRDRELGNLRQCFENVRSGSGQVIGLVGEAGIGKSRLLLEFKNSLRDAANTYLEGQCFHFGTSIAYQPFLDILRSYFNVREGMEEPLIKGRIEEMILQTDGKLHHIFSPLYDLFSLTVGDDLYTRLDPKRKREKIFEAIKDILVRESERAPLIIAIEDLQWIDKTSEEFLTYFMGWLAHTQILLILLYRPDYSHPWETQSCYQRTSLHELSEAARGEVVEFLLSGAEISEELSKLIMNRAGGNPLFLEELAYALLESGYIKRGEKGYELSGKTEEIQVPDTIQGIIAARLDRLEENLRRTVQVASVIGRRFALSILEAVVGAKEEIKAHIMELQELGFIYETILFPGPEYEFKHALVQEVAYNSLLLKRRKEVHEAIGDKIETLYSDRLEEFYEVLAHHYSRGKGIQKAWKYLKFSGIKAVKNYSLGDALRFYREAIRTLKKESLTLDNKKEETEILLLMASPIISLGFPEDSLEILQEGERLSRELNITKSLTTFCSLLGLYYSVKGDPQTGAKYGEQCLDIAEKSGDIELIAPIAFDLCSNYATTGQFSRVIEIAPRVLSLIEREKLEYESFGRGYNVYSALSSFCGLSNGYMGNFGEAKTFFEKAIRVARKTENLYSLGLAEMVYGYALAHKGDSAEALEHFENSIRYLEKGQIFVLLGLAWTGLGLAYYLKGDLEAARTQMEKGLQLHFDAGISYNASGPYRFLASVYCDLGELKKAQECAEEALRLAEKNNEIHLVGTTEIIMGRILARYGDIHQAEASILHGIETLDSQGMRTFSAIGYLALGELYALTNRNEKVFEVLKNAETIFKETGMDYWLGKAKMLLTFVEQSPINQGVE
jgi:tetratricopeptide (TPR) repeat protein